MGEKRVLFREGNWRISKSRHGVFAEHLDCKATRILPSDKLVGEDDEYPTYICGNRCFFCHSEFPDFISNMLVFVRWCRAR